MQELNHIHLLVSEEAENFLTSTIYNAQSSERWIATARSQTPQSSDPK